MYEKMFVFGSSFMLSISMFFAGYNWGRYKEAARMSEVLDRLRQSIRPDKE